MIPNSKRQWVLVIATNIEVMRSKPAGPFKIFPFKKIKQIEVSFFLVKTVNFENSKTVIAFL